MEWELPGQVALVTGAGRSPGIGRATALRLSRAGVGVVLNDLPSLEAELHDLESEIRENGGMACSVIADISESAGARAAVEAAVEQYGKLTILINNAAAAAGNDRVAIEELEEEEWDRVFRTNCRGVFLCAKSAGAQMVSQGTGGRIVNLSSIAGIQGRPLFGAYSASKFAVRGLTQSLAAELGRFGITVNSVCPSLVDTRRAYDISNALVRAGELRSHEEFIETESNLTPLGRIATADDIAGVICFLASKEAAFITGASIPVSGGRCVT